MARRGEDGFTLIEALVALAILATSAVALLGATEAHIARIGGLETRALAQVAAENRLVEIELGFGAEPVEAQVLDRRFAVAAEIAETSDPELIRIGLTVADAGHRRRRAARLHRLRAQGGREMSVLRPERLVWAAAAAVAVSVVLAATAALALHGRKRLAAAPDA
jgi:general secretion pathway protein I